MEKAKIFVKNQHGITIVKCCASCKHKLCDNRARICTIGEGIVPSDGLCPKWEQGFGFETAGRGEGKVKKKQYLNYCLTALVEDNRKAAAYAAAKKPYARMSIAEIRRDYEKSFGRIYERM